MRILLVGDIHAKQSDLEDCRKLLRLIHDTASKTNPDRIVFLGDQNHNHAVVNVFVMEFLKGMFSALYQWNPTALVGNHDMSGVEGATANAMMLYEQCEVVDRTCELDGILYVPYQPNPDAFIQKCNYVGPAGLVPPEDRCKTVICHQTFTGSTYENGFYAKDGVEPNLIIQKHVISGHIHKPQEFGKVWYPGSPRWQTVSDANIDRAIWLVEFENGEIVSRTPFWTNGVCKQIHHLEHTPVEPPDLAQIESLLKTGSVHVDLKGPSIFVDEWAERLSAYTVRLRTFKDQTAQTAVRESEGIQKAFQTYLAAFQAPNGTDTQTLANMYKERIND